LTPAQLAEFEAYTALLRDWSRRLNLTRILSQADIVRLHFLDSLACLTAFPALPGLRMIDVGTGAGFPGMPLKIARPDLRLVLLEASRRRVAFLELLVGELRLDAEVVHGRAEIIAHQPEHRERYDLVVSRATSPLDRLADLCLPFIKVGGLAVLPKGPRAATELVDAATAIEALGGEVESVRRVTVHGLESRIRTLVVLRKTRQTPGRFPLRSVRAHPRGRGKRRFPE